MSNIRLNKYIAEAGVCSRRMADNLIDDRRVKVNGNLVTEKGMIVDDEKDMIEVNGEVIKLQNKKVYILLNKPVGYVTTVKEQFNRPCVTDLIKENNRVYPIGRLDMDTSGLLILTNDGELTNKITHPKNHIYKTYEVTTYKKVSNEDVNKLKNGVDIGEYVTAPAIVNKLADTKLEISICEGKNRQVRKMIEAVGNKVKTLNRIKIGKLYLRKLKPGEYIYVSKSFLIDKIFK